MQAQEVRIAYGTAYYDLVNLVLATLDCGHTLKVSWAWATTDRNLKRGAYCFECRQRHPVVRIDPIDKSKRI
jgi:hypothetical protein